MNFAGTGWDVETGTSNNTAAFMLRGFKQANLGDGDNTTLRIQGMALDYIDFKSNGDWGYTYEVYYINPDDYYFTNKRK